MIAIESNKSLKTFNTFGFDQLAEYYTEVSTDEQLSEVVEYAHSKSWPIFILGGGSNIVLTRDISGLVIRMVGTSVNYKSGTGTRKGTNIISVSAGKNWHQLVMDTLDMGIQGLENLSLIPGSVGAAPVQNIGAYGVEVKDRIVGVRALNIFTGEWVNFTNDDCAFSYRNSYFKSRPNNYAITEVDFELGESCAANASYGGLENHLFSRGLTNPTATQISESVIAIRRSKLPDPAILGNAGSFFQNPIVSADKAATLTKRFPEVVTFEAGQGQVKVSAGWLIDNLGYKGICRGGVGVYQHQALVLVHSGGETGEVLLELATEITASVAAAYDLQLSIEPIVI